MNTNSVNPSNFNSTCRGYVKRTLKECGDHLTEEQKDIVLGKLYYAMDIMTMQDARDLDEKCYY